MENKETNQGGGASLYHYIFLLPCSPSVSCAISSFEEIAQIEEIAQ